MILNDPKFSGKSSRAVQSGITALVVLFVILALNPFVKVGPGERGVMLNFGAVQDRVLSEGIHLRVPIMQSVIKIDVRIQKEQTGTEASSKDLQDTHSTVALNYHIDPDKANWLFQNLGVDYSARVIDPTLQEVVKAVTARYTAVELITQREQIRQEIKDILKTRLGQYNLLVDDFAIVNFSFSTQFTQAIEAKQGAEQLALKAERDLDRIKVEAEQKVTQARAEAESLRLQKENVTADLVRLRQIEAQMKAIEKWNGVLPQVTGNATPFINLAPQN